MQQETVTLIVAGLGIGGTLGGIVIGHFLTRSQQREQWRFDNLKQEYKELLTTLARSYIWIMRTGTELAQGTRESFLEAENARAESFRIFEDRIYIANTLTKCHIQEWWAFAITEFLNGRDKEQFRKQYHAILGTIRQLALVDTKSNSGPVQFDTSMRPKARDRSIMRSFNETYDPALGRKIKTEKPPPPSAPET